MIKTPLKIHQIEPQLLERIFLLILDLSLGIDYVPCFGSHFRSILVPNLAEGIRRRLICDGLECAMLESFWDIFWRAYG